MIRKQTIFLCAAICLVLLAAAAAVMPSHIPVMAVLAVGAAGGLVYLRAVCRCRQSMGLLYIAYLILLFYTSAAAQNQRIVRWLGYLAECGILAAMLAAVFFRSGGLRRGVRESNVVFWIAAMVGLDVVSTLLTYRDFYVTVLSVYDSCKYLVLMLYVMAFCPRRKELHALTRVLSVFVLMNAAMAILQYAGVRNAFSHFVGRYSIVRRSGSYRAVGLFFHGIELGNYSAVMFALYYNLFRNSRSRYDLCISLLAVLCTLLSGTRTAAVNVLVIFLMTNFRDVRRWGQSLAVLALAVMIAASFLDVSQLLERTRLEVQSDTPRSYFLQKGVQVWKDHPLVGIGFATFGSQKYRERTGDMIFERYDITKYSDTSLATTDSFLAEILPEFGLFGIFLMGMFLYQVMKTYRFRRTEPELRAAMGILIAVSILSINTSGCFFSAHIGSLFWITAGTILQRSREDEELDA